MQEILFRGKRPDNGEWVYGGYCHYDDSIDNGQDTCDYIIEKHTGEYFPFVKVIPETIGQYTGLTDKNGNKIFEGDIIHKYGEYDGNFCSSNSVDYFVMNLLVGLKNAKIIGNIHDNPELLNKT